MISSATKGAFQQQQRLQQKKQRLPSKHSCIGSSVYKALAWVLPLSWLAVVASTGRNTILGKQVRVALVSLCNQESCEIPIDESECCLRP